MKRFLNILILFAGIAISAAIPPAAMGQFNSNTGTVVLNATLTESISVNVTGGGTVNFTLAPNTAANPGSTTSTIVTSWVLKQGRNKLSIWAWVSSSGAALTDGVGDNIPASAVSAAAAGSGSAGGALSTTPSGGAAPAFITAGGSGVQIGSVQINGLADRIGTTTTTLTWNINTTVVPQLPAGTYTGIVNIQAQATP